mmetsp:Transcript_70849/g.148215  ORF Transcript_70849/g.148215 Transcript_70849/m.148215 type:complete len:326 (+) Transcript_70849:152-1129(+)|eukprot:CAMPEP_0206493676 /NCGR_PEP_ID=MMETSP0324_2-20121206/47167_1 /ASSEMBLY_ACC=CAM_ASM_000836 /TAXON_ID=2866 /ORGANISM="Crypthecodinium cohnii, Strain Seligo" /LENGTH=325 /DNA_ID=CAMNT_0053976971 /DNA_START=113 /DNA_END=1090 /DNA_ORIENTATION=+
MSGTGDAPETGHQQQLPHATALPTRGHDAHGQHHMGEMGLQAAVVEMTGDLHEYGLSLGVDLDVEQEEDLAWAVREAFNAPLPSSWTEYMDDTGRAYYIKDGSTESTWEHPMDSVYRELLELIKDVRTRKPPLSLQEQEDIVRQHLRQVHQRAKADLEGWSGPYASEQGDYYYSDKLNISSWDCPTAEWEQELALRHNVLARYLMPELVATSPGSSPNGSAFGGAGASSHHMLQALRLQLGNLQRPGPNPVEGSIPEPSTSRSYHTARSHCSSRSGRSHKDRKERRTREERRAAREAAGQTSLLEERPTLTYEENGAVAVPYSPN